MVYDPTCPRCSYRRAGAQRIRGAGQGPRAAASGGHRQQGLSTGEIEVLGQELEILNRAETPPFQLDDDDMSEELRLRHRYIDLRRPLMQQRMMLRALTTRTLRRYLDGTASSTSRRRC